MLESYIDTVDAYYFPALLAAGIPFVLFAAIAPLMGTTENRPKPLALTATIMFALCFWPIVLPLSLMALAFVAFLVLASIAYRLSDRASRSEYYKRLMGRFHNQKI